MNLVVDASVAVKWWFPETDSGESEKLLAHRISLSAPDFILTEAANVVWKKLRRGEIVDARPHLDELARLPDAVALRPSASLVAHAAALAVELGHPVYDCLYLACAERENAPLVTADRELAKAAGGHEGVEVWLIGDADVARRVAEAAAALVIREERVREGVAAYEAFRGTGDSVAEDVEARAAASPVITAGDRKAALETPAYLHLVRFLRGLSRDERIDLMALGWLGREGGETPFAALLDRAYRAGVDDADYEAGLGGYWETGFRLHARPANG